MFKKYFKVLELFKTDITLSKKEVTLSILLNSLLGMFLTSPLLVFGISFAVLGTYLNIGFILIFLWVLFTFILARRITLENFYPNNRIKDYYFIALFEGLILFIMLLIGYLVLYFLIIARF